MIKKYTFWLKAAFSAQLLTAGIHALTFFNDPVPRNETETQLFELMNNYKADMGVGFSRSVGDILTAFSASFTLLLFFGGWVNWYLWRMKLDEKRLRGILRINTIVFGICFLIMVCFTFLPPIICTGIILFSLIMAWITLPKQQNT
jgi:hypothetical protein